MNSIQSKSHNIVCTEQKSSRILLMKPDCDWSRPDSIIWQWSPLESCDVKQEQHTWFELISECKCVMNGTHVLLTASGGVVALVRLADSRVVFCAYAGGNTHSAEILPDWNIVSVSSTGNFLKIFSFDPNTPQIQGIEPLATIPLEDGHGAVWDKKNQCLWTSGEYGISCFKYNFNKANPALELVSKHNVFGCEPFYGHDLFPVFGTDKLFLTGVDVRIFDTHTKSYSLFSRENSIKCITQNCLNGQAIVMKPQEKWWSDTIHKFDGIVFSSPMTMQGARFYKARWWVPNEFSY